MRDYEDDTDVNLVGIQDGVHLLLVCLLMVLFTYDTSQVHDLKVSFKRTIRLVVAATQLIALDTSLLGVVPMRNCSA